MTLVSAETFRREPDSGVPQHLFRRALSRHWVIAILVSVLVSAAGIGFALVRPNNFTSDTEILLKPLTGNPFSPDSLATPQQLTVGLETEANLVASPDVTKRVSAALGTSVPAGTGRVSASVVLNSQILQISYTGQSPAAAKDGAKAFATAVLESRQAKARSLLDNRVAGLEKQEAALEKQVDTAANEANAEKPAGAATAQLQYLTSQLASVEKDLSTARAVSTDPGTLVSLASSPSLIQRGLPFGIAGVSIILGFGLGLILAVLRAWMDDRIDPRHDLSVAGVPVWAAMGSAARSETNGLIVESGDMSVREAYRRLRSAVVANVQRPSLIAVTSYEAMPAVAEIASNLAISLHEAGYKSVLLDGEVDHPRIAELFGLGAESGLADVISGAKTIKDATAQRHGISVVTAGSNPQAVAERYSGEAFRAVAATVRAQTDYAIITADLSSAIGATITGVADCGVLVVIENVTTHEQVAEVFDRSRTQNVRIAGLATVSPAAAKRSTADSTDHSPARIGHEPHTVAPVSADQVEAGHA